MPDKRLIALAVALAAASAFFMFYGLGSGNRGFILGLRSSRLATLLVVAVAIALATMMFQTVSANRILTPSIMGFDALYLLMQTALVFFLGPVGFVALGTEAKFLTETAIMIVAALALFGTLLGRGRIDIHRMILAGVIFGVLFRSLSVFLQRLIDPNAFAVVQGASFARFSAVNGPLLWLAAAVLGLAALVIWRMVPVLDVLALGRATAINLGLRQRLASLGVLTLIAVLVAVSTALVGPVAFFGLLVSALAHALMKTHRHALLLPAAAMIAGLVLVLGQTLFERLLNLQSTLSVIVEFVGGLFFIWLLLKGRVR
ncbi:iron chelate uptake ABC transporter family permease subunit [Plastorhodobacter daqingensis]|uniref:Iron chelate uptake ABC transporter family permease subunit n=1 Tax=Plastorhodobacter daqingensis TaxID=1387281 RepID=A0ABW2URN4_9RHOB